MRKNSDKKTIRREVLLKRDGIPENIKKEKDSAIRKQIIRLPEFIKAKAILFYASFRSEADTMELIKIALSIGKHVVLPKVDKKNKKLLLYEITDIHELAKGYMGILEPSVPENRLKRLEDIELVIIPGAAFDASGNRLGYGAGYYDKLLSMMKNKIQVVAPAYEDQIVEKLPSEPHDVKVDKIVTEKRLIGCNK